MIHDIKLPCLTERCLLSIVQLQMILLEYAASDPEISTDPEKYTECRKYLDGDDSNFKGHGHQIASAFWKRHHFNQEPRRIKLLQEFSKFFHASDDPRPEYNDPVFKQNWLKRIRNEIESLHSPSELKIEIGYFYGNGRNYIKSKAVNARSDAEVAPFWQQKAGEFFLYFYEEYLEKSDNAFPASFFPLDVAIFLSKQERFGRQELLNNFRSENDSLHICPVCDENGYYTDSREMICATLDHFLPKNIYPHFACHPHNLIPTCYACNSSVKGPRDPLHMNLGEIGPGYLYREAMPYTVTKRKDNIYLSVDLSKGLKEIRILGLQFSDQLQDVNEEGLRSALEILQRIYDIPGRWATGNKIQKSESSEESKPSTNRNRRQHEALEETKEISLAADRVSEALFRRMRHFLGQGKDIMPGDRMIDELYNALSLLLYYLSEEDRWKDPLTVPMLWILAALLVQEKQQLQTIAKWKENGQLDKDCSLFPAALDEVLSWSGQDSAEVKRREDKIQQILNLAIKKKEG